MTDYMTANTINDLFRSLFALLDKAAYTLLGWMYEILFNVASADIFANDTVQKFYGRMQMIIGVFMLFKLAVSIIQGIINPDTFTDKKAGFSTIIGRVVFALILLTALTPINIPGARSSYEINLNNNGLLFGTLYELQDRILENNTLGRLILGTGDGGTFSNNAQTQAERLKKSANMFTSTILKGFVRINLKESGSDETKPEDRVCSYIEQDVLDAYADLEASPNEILSLVNASCEYQNATGFFATMGKFFTRLFTGDRYIFAYLPIISTIAAAIFIYILVGEIITIAIRSVKLAVLRLLAPIPIISYIDPKSEKDGAFGAWVKTLTSTYLELFIHLAVIYFVIFLIQDMIVNGLVINSGTGVIGVVSCIFIWIGLFFFVKQAPKFIKDILGVKNAGANVGLATMLGGAAMVAGGGGLKGFAYGAMSSAMDANEAAAQGKGYNAWGQKSKEMAQMKTGDKDARGGIFGSMLDRMEYGVRDQEAEKMGYSKRNLAIASAQAKDLQAKLGAAEQAYDDAKLALEQYEKTYTGDKSSEEYKRGYEERLAAIREARDKRDQLSIDHGKASGVKKDIESYRANLRTAPRIYDTTTDTYRSNEQAIDGYERDPETGAIYNIDSNFESAAEPVNPYKGSKNPNTRTDDDSFSSSGGGGHHGGHGGHH